MKRLYKVSIEVVAEFQRKVRIRTVQKELAARLKLPEPWKLAGVSSRSIAKPERTEKPKAPWEGDLLVEKQLVVLRGILDDLHKIRPSGKRAWLELWPNRWCNHPARRPEYGAHSHTRNDRVRRGTRLYNRKGLICITPREVLQTIDGTPEEMRHIADLVLNRWKNRWGGSYSRKNAVWLMAHEWTHQLLPGGSHNRQRFKDLVADLEKKYAEMKAGTWTPPAQREPGWVKRKEERNLFDEWAPVIDGQLTGTPKEDQPSDHDTGPTMAEEAQRRMRETEESERQSP